MKQKKKTKKKSSRNTKKKEKYIKNEIENTVGEGLNKFKAGQVTTERIKINEARWLFCGASLVSDRYG